MSKVWLSDPQICVKLGGMSRSGLHRNRDSDPKFPKPRLFHGRNLTPEEEIDAYVEEAMRSQEQQVLAPALPDQRPRTKSGRFAKPGQSTPVDAAVNLHAEARQES